MKEFVKRCDSDPLCRIPMMVCGLCLVLSLILPEPWRMGVIDVGAVLFAVGLIAVLLNIRKERTKKKLSKKSQDFIARIDDVLFVAYVVLGFLVLLWYVWIAPLLK